MPNALHFLDFTSWCKDSAIPSKCTIMDSPLYRGLQVGYQA